MSNIVDKLTFAEHVERYVNSHCDLIPLNYRKEIIACNGNQRLIASYLNFMSKQQYSLMRLTAIETRINYLWHCAQAGEALRWFPQPVRR